MRYVRDGLGGLLLFCLVIRLAAWLVTPAIPLLLVLTAIAYITYLLTLRR